MSVRKQQTKWEPEDIDRALEMLRTGAKVHVVAQEFGRTGHAVASMANKHGVAIAPSERVKWTREMRDQLLELYAQGKSDADICREMGLSHASIQTQRSRMKMGRSHWSRGSGPKTGYARPCMCCRQPFLSEGKHNRLCEPCGSSGDDGLPSHSFRRAA